MIFQDKIYKVSKEWREWCNKDEEEQENIAYENGWDWYFEWFDVGDRLRYKYEQADKDPKVSNKYGGYDRWYEEHEIGASYVYLGADACFHETDKPISKWTVFNECTNYNCPHNKGEDEKGNNRCDFFYDNTRMYDCFNQLFACLQAVKDVTGGLSIIEKHFDVHQDIIGWFEQGNEYFKNKGDDKMSKPFIRALNDLNNEDDISVYWNEGMMYISDESDNEQAVTSCSLFDAYRFSLLINSQIFDYTASDEEVNQLQKQLISMYKKELDYGQDIDVWEYLDDIANDFHKLTGITINDIDYKRQIVAYMSDTSDVEFGMDFGSATFIARLLSDHIIGDEEKRIKKCNNKQAIELANKYLQTGDYDLIAFQKALHKTTQTNWITPKSLKEFLEQSSIITEKCYYLLGTLRKNEISYKGKILVGYIDWFGDYKENERKIYCHIDTDKNQIYFKENRKARKNAFLHDIAFQYLITDLHRIQHDIEIKLTQDFIDNEVKNKIGEYTGEDWGYIHCHMGQTIGSYK